MKEWHAQGQLYLFTFSVTNYNLLVSNVEWLLCLQRFNEGENETLVVDKLFKLKHCCVIICSGSINTHLILNLKETVTLVHAEYVNL
jgi:hypothetical protein